MGMISFLNICPDYAVFPIKRSRLYIYIYISQTDLISCLWGGRLITAYKAPYLHDSVLILGNSWGRYQGALPFCMKPCIYTQMYFNT